MRRSIFVFVLAVLCAVADAHAALRALLVAQGFIGIVAVVPDPRFPDTVYVAQADGQVIALRAGQRLSTLFLDLRGVVTTPGGERGLLGMAFPKDAASSGRVFVNFTDAAGHTVVARFTRASSNPRTVDPASRKDLQWPAGGSRQGFITQPTPSHNGGHLAFGPDGYLYIGLGDGGGDNDPSALAQSPTTLLGKVLRVNVSVPDADPIGYAIPPGNPVFPIPGALPEIWAFGVRNPWRYSFDDVGTGATDALFLADVGQSAREEIDVELPGPGGRNYGWRAFEGSLPNPNLPPEPLAFLPHAAPVHDFDRTLGWSITGGYVYRGEALPTAVRGRYFFGDCILGKVRSLGFTTDLTAGTVTATDVIDHTTELGGRFRCITTFARDRTGELYFADIDFANAGAGRVFQLVDGDRLLPDPPVNITASVQGSTVSLAWTAATTGGTTSSYLLEAGTAPGLADLAVVPTPAPSFSAPGVPDGTYHLRVRAVGLAGTSAPSANVPVVVGCVAPPPAPASYSASVAAGVVTLAWTVPAGAIGVRVEVGFATTATDVAFDVPATSASFSAPAPPGSYFTRVRAVNACGTSAPSIELTLTVP